MSCGQPLAWAPAPDTPSAVPHLLHNFIVVVLNGLIFWASRSDGFGAVSNSLNFTNGHHVALPVITLYLVLPNYLNEKVNRD